jgi:tetratricopeptide (TPR) repeat protein
MAGKITSHDLTRSMDLVKQGKTQGEALIQLGIINSKILNGVLKWQAELKLAEIFTWKEGEGSYEFYRAAAFTRDFTPVQIVLGGLILKGIKRGFPFSTVQSRIKPYMNQYVIKRSKTEFDPLSLNFQLPEQRLYEKVIDGSLTIKQIIEESQMDPQLVSQLIYALIATKLVELRDRPATGSDEDQLLEDLKSRLSLSRKGDFFDCLGIHWTSVGWKVQEGWEKIQRFYGPDSKYQQSGVDEIMNAAKDIYDFGKKAYEVLINDQRRVEYRKEIFNETKLMLSSDLQYQQAESQLLWKEDYRHAIEILESAAELAPNNWVIQAAYACALVKRYYPSNPEYQKGEKVLQRALTQGSKNDVVHFYAGHAYWALRRTTQARTEFEIALRINPKNFDAAKALRAMAKASS